MTHTDDDLSGLRDPDFLAIGLGGTNMMAMLWTVAMGRRTVGVEMRGSPFLGVHWNIRADFYHQLGLIDEMMLARYGEEGVPTRLGARFKLAELFFSTKTVAGDIIADSIVDGYDTERHIAGTIQDIEFIDDRWRDGVPTRHLTLLQPPAPPTQPDPAQIRRSLVDVLDGPSTFQGSASSVLILLRRYLEKIEEMDIERGVPPRVRLFLTHRVVATEGDGFVRQPDGRFAVRIEQLKELDYAGRFVRVRTPGSELIDIGVPELFMIAEGFRSTDAERLGFMQEDVRVDHADGRGPVVAQADFLAGLIEVLVGGRLRRRIASEFDADGREYWVRQIAVGHENDPEVGWILVQVPDFKTFDPVVAGTVPPGTDPKSPEYFAAYEQLVHDYYMEQISEILELPAKELKKIQMVYGPKMFSLVERMGESARLAVNGVVAGDSFGNGHFLTSGGAMTAMVGHGAGLLDYWQARDSGASPEEATDALAAKIKDDTLAWLHVSATEYTDAHPINFGADRIRQISEATRATGSAGKNNLIDSSRRQRHSLLLLNPSDWRRPLLRAGKVFSGRLPELHVVHPALRRRPRTRRNAQVQVTFLAASLSAQVLRMIEATMGQPGVQVTLVSAHPATDLPERIRERLASVVVCPMVTDGQMVADALRARGEAHVAPDVVVGVESSVQQAVRTVRRAFSAGGESGMMQMHDPVAQREALVNAGIPVPAYAVLRSLQDGMAFAEDRGYFPLALSSGIDDTGAVHVIDDEAGLAARLSELAPSDDHPVIGAAVLPGRESELAVMCIDGIPAWSAAARCSHTERELRDPTLRAWRRIMPREVDDPADSVTRQMSYRALRAIGMETGIGYVTVGHPEDGARVVLSARLLPPADDLFTLMRLAHGADLYRAWATCMINGVFAPIPRVAASGIVYLRGEGEGARIVGVDGWDTVREQFADVIVEAAMPSIGTDAAGTGRADGWVAVRHAETARVEAALSAIEAQVVLHRGE